MFSLMLSSEDFPIPMETSEPEAAVSPHPPMTGAAPISQTLFPPSQASHSYLPPPPPPPPSISVPCVPLVPDRNDAPAAVPGLPLSSNSPLSNPVNPLKRCDDDVQFVSEKPVKRRKLESPAAPNPVNIQPQGIPPVQAGPPLSHGATPPVREGEGGSGPPICNFKHTSKAVSEPMPKTSGTETTDRITSLPSLESYVFPASFPSGPAVCRKDSPQLSPKQIPNTVAPTLLERPNSQLAVPPPEKSQGSPGDTTGTGGPRADTVPKDLENETAAPLAQSNQKGLPDGDREPIDIGTDASATPRIPPVGGETGLQATGPAHNLGTAVPEVSPGNRLPVNGTPSHHQSASRELAHKKHQGPTASSATVPPYNQSNSRPPSPASAHPQHISAVAPAPDASHPSQQNSETGIPWPRSDHTLPANAGVEIPRTEGPSLPPSAPKAAVSQLMGPAAPTRSHMPGRSPTQLQAQASQLLTRPESHQMHSQGHSQSLRRAGIHPPGSGPSKAHCRICAARRQQAALQRTALSGNGRPPFPQGTLPPGTVPSRAHAQAPNSAGYNVVYVPTPMQGPNGPTGTQFNRRPNQPNTSVGVMGMSSHPYMLQNPPPGIMAGPTLPNQTPQAPRPSMISQAGQSRPEPRASPQQAPPPRKFAHQDPSPGKHIIVDIADTAMEAFPFAKVANRHNVPVDKVRNMFEAIVALPLLRVSADKRRAGKIGQERARRYAVAKKEVEKQRAEEGQEGSEVSVYDMATAMGPETPEERAQGLRGPC